MDNGEGVTAPSGPPGRDVRVSQEAGGDMGSGSAGSTGGSDPAQET